jgi:hypothetical protein
MIEIKLLKKNEESSYTRMLHKCNEAMIFHSIPYRDLLEEFLSVKSYSIIAKRDNEIIGAIPAYIKENRQYGNVINSSPFFGSHGGFLLDSSLNYLEGKEIKKKLLQKYNDLAIEKDCILSTIITSPFDHDILFYEDNLEYKYRDYRIGSIKEFYKYNGNIDNALMSTTTSRCRRAIRRAIKHGITFENSDDFCPLFEMHKEGMSIKDGLVKPLGFFQKVSKLLRGYYELAYARKEDTIIAGLLAFKFKNTIEYYTPALFLDYAKEQGTSFLIFKEMEKAMENNYKYWNFGGTGESQTGVYMFKKSWGADDFPYYYYISQYAEIDKILELEPKEISEKYKWFYVVPFNQLKG